MHEDAYVLQPSTKDNADLRQKFIEKTTDIWWSVIPHIANKARAVTLPLTGHRSLITIGSEPMKTLGDPDTTIAEKCMAYFDLTNIVRLTLHLT